MTVDRDPRPDGGVQTSMGFVDTRRRDDRFGDMWAIASTEYRLAIRNRWAIVLTLVFMAFGFGLLTFSGASVGPDGFARIVASLAVLAVYLVPLAAMVFGYDLVVGAHEDGWLAALFALPVQRWRIVLGTFSGRAIAFAAAIGLGFGIPGLVLLAEIGLIGWEQYAIFLLATIATGLAFLGIALVLSTVAREKTHALGAALGIWAWFVLVHDLLALGLFAAFRLPDSLLSAMVLSNPAGVYRVLVLGSLGASGEAGFASVLTASGLGTPTLVGALLAWLIFPVLLACMLVQRRRVE